MTVEVKQWPNFLRGVSKWFKLPLKPLEPKYLKSKEWKVFESDGYTLNSVGSLSHLQQEIDCLNGDLNKKHFLPESGKDIGTVFFGSTTTQLAISCISGLVCGIAALSVAAISNPVILISVFGLASCIFLSILLGLACSAFTLIILLKMESSRQDFKNNIKTFCNADYGNDLKILGKFLQGAQNKHPNLEEVLAPSNRLVLSEAQKLYTLMGGTTVIPFSFVSKSIRVTHPPACLELTLHNLIDILGSAKNLMTKLKKRKPDCQVIEKIENNYPCQLNSAEKWIRKNRWIFYKIGKLYTLNKQKYSFELLEEHEQKKIRDLIDKVNFQDLLGIFNTVDEISVTLTDSAWLKDNFNFQYQLLTLRNKIQQQSFEIDKDLLVKKSVDSRYLKALQLRFEQLQDFYIF